MHSNIWGLSIVSEETMKIEGQDHGSQRKHQTSHVLTIHMKDKHMQEQQYSFAAG